jgi:ribose transport system substrate-binding protein
MNRANVLLASLCVVVVGWATAGCGGSSSSSDSSTTATAAGGAQTSAAGASTTADASPARGALANAEWKNGLHGAVSKATVNGDTVTIDVGGGKTVTQKKSDPLKIAYFELGSATTYGQNQAKGATDAAKQLGDSITVFDGAFNPQTQNAQLQNALASGKFNAFVGTFTDSNIACRPMTEAAPKANILAVAITLPLCGKGSQAGEHLWSPGLLSTINGSGTAEFERTWVNDTLKSVTAPTEVAYIGGPQGQTAETVVTAALRDAAKKNPNVKVVGLNYTPDYATAAGLAATQNLLTAHPKLAVIMSQNSSLTTGILQALKQAGKSGKLRIISGGGDSVDVPYIKSGAIESSIAYFPATAAACGVALVHAAHNGQTVPRSMLNDCRKTGGDNTAETPLLVTKGNANTFKPEY